MSHATSVVEELEDVLASGSNERRSEILRRVTDLFLTTPGKLTQEQTSLFDDVIGRLVGHLERRALAELSKRLAPIPHAPPQTIQRLATDEAIEVAGPILAGSDRLTDQNLVEIAESKGQSHLSKIAERRNLSATVTDVLVDRGDREVVNKVAANSGAQFSKSGMSTLVMRADGDDELVETIARRNDIPPFVFGQLLSYATEHARQRLLAAAQPETRNVIDQTLVQVSDHLNRVADTVKGLASAQRLVLSFSQDTELTRTKLLEFADGKRITEMVAALSALSGTSTDLVGRLICDQYGFGTMMLCKAIKLDWSITHAVLTAGPSKRSDQIEQLCEDFERLSVSSAQRLLNVWQGSQRARASFANSLAQSRLRK